MSWTEDLYKETKEKWIEAGRDRKGYAIFYSPVKMHPKLAIIGFNPGGDENSFNENDISIPEKHEYITEDYKIASNMKKIFGTAGISNILEESVKFNLLFYRSTKAKDIKNKELIAFSERKTLEILNYLKPENMLAEGFQTYERLKHLLKGTDEQITRLNDKAVVCTCKTCMNIPLIGIIHPSGARGVTNEMLNFIGLEIKRILDERV